MEDPDEISEGEAVTLYLNPSNPQPYTIVQEQPSQTCETNSFVLRDVKFANDRSHEVYGSVPNHIDQLPDEGVELNFETETGRLLNPSGRKVAVSAELVFFTEDGVFAHNVEWN